jgi:hypothetical protein
MPEISRSIKFENEIEHEGNPPRCSLAIASGTGWDL